MNSPERTKRTKLKQEAKMYIQALYTQHRMDDIDSWSHLIDVVFMYIDAVVDQHAEEHHEETEE